MTMDGLARAPVGGIGPRERPPTISPTQVATSQIFGHLALRIGSDYRFGSNGYRYYNCSDDSVLPLLYQAARSR